MGIITNFVCYGKTRMVFVTELKDSKESLTAPVEEQCFEKKQNRLENVQCKRI